MLTRCIAQSDGGALQLRGGHLARHGAFPDQRIQLCLIAAAKAVLAKIGRTDRLVGFLRILGLGGIETRLFRAIGGVIALANFAPTRSNRRAIHLHTIGPHIGDRARFVETLRGAHRLAGRESQLARGLLLHGRGGERRRRIALQRLFLDFLNGETPSFHGSLGFLSNALMAEAELFELFALILHQPRIELRRIMLQLGKDGPVLVGLESLNLALALNDQAQRDGLHPARRLRAGKLAPQDRRERETEQIIERAAPQISVNQVLIEIARLAHSFGDGRLGYRVERHPLHVSRQRAAFLEHVEHVPADRFAFAVRVGCEDQARGVLGRISNGFHLLAIALVGIDLPIHRKVFIGPHTAILGRQIADMAIGGENLEVLAQILFDGLRLGGRFNDNKLHDGSRGSLHVYARARVGSDSSARQGPILESSASTTRLVRL